MLGLSGEAAGGWWRRPSYGHLGRESSRDPGIGSLRAVSRSRERGRCERDFSLQVQLDGKVSQVGSLRKESTPCSFEGRAGSGSPAARAPGTGVRPATGKAGGTASSAQPRANPCSNLNAKYQMYYDKVSF